MSEPEILFECRSLAGAVTLNRPSALNALTLAMVRDLHPRLDIWARDTAVHRVVVEGAGERAFCAGGDIRALYEWGLARDTRFLDFYAEEYRLNTAIKRFPKPYVAILDGITMGGGVGVSVHGSHRVATERLVFAMPETGIGLFPDVGGSHFLPRCPGEIGMYLGLTGHRLKAADAVYAGIATHHVTSDKLPTLKSALDTADDIDIAIAALATDPGPAPLAEHRAAIDRHFGLSSVEEILASLEAENDEWSIRTAEILRGKSPTSLKVSYRQIREGAGLEFEDCMRLEYRIVNGIFRGRDFFEGTRAVVIDKDQSPQWDPATLDAVTPEMVDGYFTPLERELDLPDPLLRV